MNNQNSDYSGSDKLHQGRKNNRGFSLPLRDSVSPMPQVKPPRKEENNSDMFGRKTKERENSYYQDKKAFLAESKYVGEASELISHIHSAKSRGELCVTEKRLNQVIKAAVNAHIPNRDLITIEEFLSQGMYQSDWSDQQSGGGDSLLQQRISILQKAYNYLDSSF